VVAAADGVLFGRNLRRFNATGLDPGLEVSNMEVKITLRNAEDCIDNHDIAVLAKWAGQQRKTAPNSDLKTAFALMQQGADLLLRQRHLN
jgi:hypothetical protein